MTLIFGGHDSIYRVDPVVKDNTGQMEIFCASQNNDGFLKST